MRLNKHYTIFFFVACLMLFKLTSYAQTTLLNPTGAGGFELGSGFPANGWTVVNGAQTNKWWCNTPGNPASPFAGTNCAYISDNISGTTHNYNVSSTSVVHIYRDITIPAGEPYITLSFRWKTQGENNYDYIRVHVVSTSTTPVAGTLLTTGQLGGDFNQSGSWQLFTSTFCAVPGSSIRLVFSWRNDGSIGTQPPGTLDNISVVSSSSSPPCNLGTGVTNVPALPYSSGAGTTCGAVNDLTSLNTMTCGSSLYLGGEDRVWIFTPLTAGSITINLTSSGSWTGLMLYDGCPLSGSCSPGGIPVCCVASVTGSSGNKTLVFCAKANVTYYLILDSYPAPTCNPYSNLTISAPSGSCTGNTDCYFGTTVCNNSSFTGNSSGYGCTQELHAGNQGCLSSGENQSAWYLFSPSTSGNIGFTIAPNSGIDYDFAVWGPYPPGSNSGTICPPASLPIRCSYASGATTFSQTGSYNTGIGHATYSVPQFAVPTPAYTDGTGNTLNGWVPGITATAGDVYILLIDNFTSNTTPFNLTWNLGPGVILDCTPLPIELLSFTGEGLQSGNLLTWTTASERYADYFEVLHATDASFYTPVGRMKAIGNSAMSLSYVFNHTRPSAGSNYYQLRMVDFDGSEQFSEVIVLRNQATAGLRLLSLHPNPTNDILHAEFSGNDATFSYILTDVLGNILYQSALAKVPGSARVNIDVSSFPAGIYFMHLLSPDGEGMHEICKVVKH